MQGESDGDRTTYKKDTKGAVHGPHPSNSVEDTSTEGMGQLCLALQRAQMVQIVSHGSCDCTQSKHFRFECFDFWRDRTRGGRVSPWLAKRGGEEKTYLCSSGLRSKGHRYSSRG